MAPVFLLFLFAIFGVGIDGFYQLDLDEAVRNAARQIQIGGPASQSGPNFAIAVCSEMAIASGCTSNVSYVVQTDASTGTFASLTPQPLPATGAFANLFQPCGANRNILVQVAYPMPLTLPFIGSVITLTGTNSIMAITTVRSEPYS